MVATIDPPTVNEGSWFGCKTYPKPTNKIAPQIKMLGG